MIMAMGPAIVARTFPAAERGRALGLNGISVSIGLSLGPALGGILTQVATWRAIFLINAPIGLLAILWAARVLPAETPGKGQSFDARGATLSGAALFALLLALSDGQQWGWTSPAVVGLLIAFVVLGAAFIAVGTPLHPADGRSRALPNQALHGRPGQRSRGVCRPVHRDLPAAVPAAAGTRLLADRGRPAAHPVPITMALVAPFSGAASDRFGPRVLASTGMAIMALSLLSLTQLPVDFGLPDLIWRLVLLGLGQGLFMSPNSSAVLGSVPRPRVGTASGTLAQMRVNGQALGIALSGAIVATRLPVHLAALGGGAPTAAMRNVALAGAIHDAFLVAAVICSLGIVASLVRGSSRPRQPAGGLAPASDPPRKRGAHSGPRSPIVDAPGGSLPGSWSFHGQIVGLAKRAAKDYGAPHGRDDLPHLPLVLN